MKAAMNLQDSFLNQVRKENSEVKVLLVNGNTLRGTVKGFDNFTLILNSRNGQHLVYKHAIAQVLQQRPSRTEEVSHSDSESETSAAPAADTTDIDSSEALQEAGTQPVDRPARAPRPERPAQQPRHQRPPRNANDRGGRPERNPEQTLGQDQKAARAKKEGFNTLDLSKLKIDEKS